MGKDRKQTALKRVFQDITNIGVVIQDCKKVEETFNVTNFGDQIEADKIIDNTKAIIDRLRGDVNKISDYFEAECKEWQDEVNNGDCNLANEGQSNTTFENEISSLDSSFCNVNETIECSSDVLDRLPNSESDTNIVTETKDDTSTTTSQENDVQKSDNIDKLPGLVRTGDVHDTTNDVADKDESPNSVEQTNHVDACSGSAEVAENDTKNSTNKEDQDSAVQKKQAKVFLKCIDINKLKPTTGTNDSVLVISDSEPDNDQLSQLSSRKKSSAKSKNQTVNSFRLNISDEITISKINKSPRTNNDDDEVQAVEKQKDSELVKLAERALKSFSSKTTLPAKKKTAKDSLKITKSVNSDSSSKESDDSYKHKRIRRLTRKLPKRTRKEQSLVDAECDKKFGYTAYVPLPRYPCEKLKHLYLNKLDHNEVERLSDLNSLNMKKRKRDKHKDTDSSSTEKQIGRSKRKRNKSTDSQKSSDANDSDIDLPSVQKENLFENGIDADPAVIILNDVGSATDASTHDGDTDKNKKKSKKDSEGKKSKRDTESKKKNKWREDKLLKTHILDSDSDSEDEFSKFKKQRESSKTEVKKRLAKARAKKVIESDSSSESDSPKKHKQKKKESESSAKPSSSSSSSSSEKESSDDRNKKEISKPKKGGRIKRMKDSSSDEDKSTRKTIRKVIGDESLKETTKQAEKDERDRKARISERQKKYNMIFDADKPADSTVDKVVLDFNEETKEELLSIDKNLVAKLKPHQVTGIQFMWNACYESLERTEKTNGSGCILAHCMGLGKTLQVIALLHALIMDSEKTGVKKVMVVCPVNTVLNWVDEFSKWLGELDGPEIEIYELVSNKQNSYRMYLVKQWSKHGGVLVVGYDMFRNLTNTTNKRIRKQMRETFHNGMVDPGPDLIICDEGHLLKNEKTNLSVAISRVRTERRIVLTGTPMQNNLKEYYCMVQFVKPNLLGTYKEYLNRFVNPITNGQYIDSTEHDISIMKKRSHVLHKMLDGIVQRKDYGVLAPYLAPKYEYVIFTKLSEVQIKLYQYYMDNFARRPVESKLRKTAFLFSDFQEFQRICTHPKVLLIKSIENKKKAIFIESDEDSEGSLKDFIDDKNSEKSTSSSSKDSDNDSDDDSDTKKKKHEKEKPAGRLTRTAAAAAGIEIPDKIEDIIDDNDELNNWWRQIVDGDELENIALGGKIYLLFEILQQCELIGDKLLIFSQSLYSLNIIEYFLGKIDEATQDGKNETVCGFSGSWAAGLDYFRIDGSSSCDNRAAWCKRFNDPDNHRARLFLISTKAGGLGINLIGANRVIIFDVSWNPSHDTQSIYRVYRFGQTKPCYIYRFVTQGTMEMKIYERQVTKQAISKRVIDEQQIDRHYNQNDLAELYNFDPNPSEAQTPLLPKDVLLAELLQKEKDRIYRYHEHQSLLENKEGEELDEAERKAAWEEYEHEKTNPPVPSVANYGGGAGWIRHLPVASVTAALASILSRDNPTWTREQVQAVIPHVIVQLREQVDKGETVLFNRIINELKVMQVQQQQKLQQYYLQQQLRMLQQQQQTLGESGRKQSGMSSVQTFRSILNNALNSAPRPTNSNEIVDLND